MLTGWTLKVVAAVAVVVLGVGAMALLFRGSVRNWIDDRYTRVSSEAGGRSVVYTSPKAASTVTGEITGRWKPGDRLANPSGNFLRYDDTVVAVTPSGGGSRITVDDEDRGYARWYPFVGGWWGTYSGPGETFRGGGPGAGK
jgi:hypothetical protein